MYDGFWGSPRHKEILQIVKSKGPVSSEGVQKEFLKNPNYRATVNTIRRRLAWMVGKGEIRKIGDNLYSG